MTSPVDLLFPKSLDENKRLFVKSIEDYLNQFPFLNHKLRIIQTWLERIKQGKRIFSDLEGPAEIEVYENFRTNLNNPFGFIYRSAIQDCKGKLYETPEFLREFEYLATEFPNDLNTIYQIQPGINTLQEHVNFFKAASLRRKLESYRNIFEPNYEQIITNIITNNIQCNKATMNRAVFANIVDQLKDNKIQLAAFLQRVNENPNESLHIRLCAKLLYINEMYENKRSMQEMLTEMAQLGTAEDIMWLLCNDYHKTLNRNVRKNLGNLILFLSKQGVKSEMCVRKNISAAELLFSAKLCSQSKDDADVYDEEERKEVYTVMLNSISKKSVLKMANQKRSNVLLIFNRALYLIGFAAQIATFILFLGTPFSLVGLAGFIPFIFRNELWSFFFNRILFVPPAENPAQNLASEEIRPFESFFRPSRIISNLSKIFSPLVKIANIFNTTLTPYAEEQYSKYGTDKDVFQVFDGIKHIIKGAFKVLGSVVALLDYRRSFSSVGVQTMNGLFTMVRGIAEVVTFLPVLFFKVPIRYIITLDETRESKMMDTAEQLKMELENQWSRNDYALDHSPKQIHQALFNQAADLHKQTKEFKETVNPEKTPFKEREKAEWKKVKLQFFAGFKREQQAITDDEKAVLRNYSKVFTR